MAVAVARDEARATRSVTMSSSAGIDSSSDEDLDAAAVEANHGGGGTSCSMLIKRTELSLSDSISNPLELRSLTLWAPGTCPGQPEQRIAGIGAQNVLLTVVLCSGFGQAKCVQNWSNIVFLQAPSATSSVVCLSRVSRC